MNIISDMKAKKREREWKKLHEEYMRGSDTMTYRIRVGYPGYSCDFGEAKVEMPRALAKRISGDEAVEYFNLVSRPEEHPKLPLTEEDCMYLAKMCSEFQESPLSRFRGWALFELYDAFRESPKEQQSEILEKYFGPGEVDKLSTGEFPPYYGLGDLFDQELATATLGLVLTILDKEYGKDLFDLEQYLRFYSDVMKPHAVSGIPTVVLSSGEVFSIVLEGEEDKILVLNAVYNDGGPNWNGPGGYICGGWPNFKTITLEELNNSGGHIMPYYP